tara:strand:- start:54 stop:284 length:231 start_codon:yes stop_codon:yes gene_type:complete
MIKKRKEFILSYSIIKKDYSIQTEDGQTDELMTELVRAVKETEIKGVHITLPRALKIAEKVKPVFEQHGKLLYSNQ